MKKEEKSPEIFIDKISTSVAQIWIKGLTPFISNCISAKAKMALLYPKTMTAADKKNKIKHNPMKEYRDSVHRQAKGETRIVFPAAGFKGAMCNSAVEISSTSKAQVGRLLWVLGDTVNIYGIPQMWTTMVRNAGINTTPDPRTRAIIPEWATCLKIQYVKPAINETAICRLLETAGLINGVGDFHQQKGKGNYGQFTLATKEEVADIVAMSTMEAQDKALENPQFYDNDTEELYNWYTKERKNRGQ